MSSHYLTAHHRLCDPRLCAPLAFCSLLIRPPAYRVPPRRRGAAAGSITPPPAPRATACGICGGGEAVLRR